MTLAQPPPEGRVSPDDDAASLAETLRAEANPCHVIFFVESRDAPHRGGRIGQVVPLNCGTFPRKPPLPVDEGRSSRGSGHGPVPVRSPARSTSPMARHRLGGSPPPTVSTGQRRAVRPRDRGGTLAGADAGDRGPGSGRGSRPTSTGAATVEAVVKPMPRPAAAVHSSPRTPNRPRLPSPGRRRTLSTPQRTGQRSQRSDLQAALPVDPVDAVLERLREEWRRGLRRGTELRHRRLADEAPEGSGRHTSSGGGARRGRRAARRLPIVGFGGPPGRTATNRRTLEAVETPPRRAGRAADAGWAARASDCADAA
jgi:hypothetical protein